VTVEIDVLDWHTLAFALLVLGFLPGFVLRQIVRIYPKDDPRRQELVAEMYAIRDWVERPLFVAQQFETALTEGIAARRRARRRSRAPLLAEPAPTWRDELRRLRQVSGLSPEEVAAALDWAEMKVDLIERGRRSMTRSDLRQLLHFYNVTDRMHFEALLAAVRVEEGAHSPY
jgi:hypothetical protein